MYFRLNFLCFILLNFIKARNSTDDFSKFQWISSNFGSSFSTSPCFYDLNHDGSIDMLSISVDGEIISHDITTGEPIINSNWPVYLSNDHFFSKPIMHIYGENYNQESILLISQKGLMYFLDWNGILMYTLKLDNIFLTKKWSFIHFKTLFELVSMKKPNVSNDDIELYPEIYADGVILDLNVTGVSSDLVIPVNFVSKNLESKDVVISAIVVYNLITRQLLYFYPLQISLKNSESPGYLMTNFEVLNTDTYYLIVTSTSGVIYKLMWNRNTKEFTSLFQDSLIYNIGPNKCQVTEFCKSHNNTFTKNALCCIYIDYYGHMVVMDLMKPGSIWEYEFKDAGTPTETEVFMDNSMDLQNTYAVFATNQGWIHCVSLLTGTSKPLFPILIENASFITKPKIVLYSNTHVYIVLLSDEGSLHRVLFDNPKVHQIIIHNEQISSYLPPIIFQTTNKNSHSNVIIQSKSGFIFKYEIFDTKPKEEKFVRNVMNEYNSKSIGTLYGSGSVFGFSLQINDPVPLMLESAEYYIIKIFVNEYLYVSRKEWSSGNEVTDVHVIIDLKKVDRQLIPESVFIFGTMSIKVTNSVGRAFPVDYMFLRMNFDFQFELIWIVYLTFVICMFGFLIAHFFSDSQEFIIPLYDESR